MNNKHLLLALLILSLALVSPACNDTDPVASSGSTITVAANPQNIFLAVALTGRGFSTISAIVLTSSGTRQTGVEVIFTTDEGCFGTIGPAPGFETCLTGGEGDGIEIALTSSDGIASVDLFTFVGTTVQVQSGSAIGTETVTVGGAQVVGQVVLIALDGITDIPFDSDVDFRVTVTDTEFRPVPDAAVTLDIDPSTAAIPDLPITTDADGQAEFVLEVTDCFNIRAQVSGVFSDPPLRVTVLNACP